MGNSSLYWSLGRERRVNECERQTSIVRGDGAYHPKIFNDASWFSSITFEPSRSPGPNKFPSALSCDQQFFDVANARAGYRVANMFAPPSPMAPDCIHEAQEPLAQNTQ